MDQFITDAAELYKRRLKTNIALVCDCVKKIDFVRGMDAEDEARGRKQDDMSSVFVSQLVHQTIGEVFKHEYPETKWVNGGLITQDTSLSDGTREYGYQELGSVGAAAITADNATDIPKVSIEGKYNLGRVFTVSAAFEYDRQTLRTARMMGRFDIATEKGQVLREAVDNKLNTLIERGDAGTGLRGVINSPGIIVNAVTTGTWSSATRDQIVADFDAQVLAMISGSNGVEVPDTALFPIAQYQRLTTLRNSDQSDKTVLEWLQSVHPYIKKWEWVVSLSTANQAGTGPAFLLYKNDRKRLRALTPMGLAFLPPQVKGLTFEVIAEMRFGGVIVPRPGSVLLATGI